MDSPLKQISQHVIILNHELGIVKNDVKWIKKLFWWVAGMVSITAIKTLVS